MRTGFEKIGRTISLQHAKRACLDKKQFRSKTIARDHIAAYLREHPEWTPKRAYRCSICGGWHLTSQQPEAGGKILKKRQMP